MRSKSGSKRSSSMDRSVPSSELASQPREIVLSVSSINLSTTETPTTEKSVSLFARDSNGNIYTNLNIQEGDPSAMAQQLSISEDHVKYINLFAILCCWCFPITGVLSIIFARKTRRYYDANEMIRAKWYLNRAEWMLLLTFFFGLTLIATGFALLEVFLFNSRKSVPYGVFHST